MTLTHNLDNISFMNCLKLKKKLVLIVFGLSFFSLSPLPIFSIDEVYKNKYALVVGIKDYPFAPLRNPLHDSKDMTDTLRKLGFKVKVMTNATKKQFEYAIRSFGRKLTRTKGVGLFYYSGHGVQYNGKNFLIPIDAKIEKEYDIEYEGVNLSRLLSEMEYANNRLNIIILDACRSNPYSRFFRSMPRGLAPINGNPSGTIIAYSTSPNNVANDGYGKNGLYTQELLKYMRVPGKKIEDVFKEVRISVKQLSNGRQTPWETTSLEGDFYFVPVDDMQYEASGSNYLYPVKIDNKWGYKDKYNNIVISPQYNAADPFVDGLARVKVNDINYGYIDKNNRMIVKPYLQLFFEGLAFIKINNKYGYINKQGKIMIKPEYDMAGIFSEGLASVKINGKFGYIDRKGRLVIRPKYDWADIFSEGLAGVKINKKIGYIDRRGRFRIPPKFEYASSFSKGEALVKVKNSWGSINKRGNITYWRSMDY